MSPSPSSSSPWHAGERAVHARVGETALVERIQIDADIPPAAAEFLAEQTLLYVAAVVDEHIWVSPLTGSPGFTRATAPTEITIAGRPPAGDPISPAFDAPHRFGGLAIEPATRKRMRFNGRTEPTENGIVVSLDQLYANCPRFIQKRTPGTPAPAVDDVPDPVATGQLTEHQAAWLASADTFVIGTADRDGNADASHRGGAPGFVTVMSPGRFRFPDYAGNHMYMTLGNLEVRRDAGFLFVDWVRGSILQISGVATVEYDRVAAEAEFAGAARIVDVRLTRVVETTHRLPAAWSAPEYSRFNPVRIATP